MQNCKRSLIWVIFGLFFILYLFSGCSGLGSGSGHWGSAVAFTPYPPMPGQPQSVSSKSTAAGKDSYSLALAKGWSTVSFPFNSLVSTSSFDHQIQYWDGSQYQPVNPSADAAAINCSLGYWAYQDNAATATINGGSGPVINSVTLKTGWNLIGFPNNAAKNFSDLTLTFNNQTKPLTEAATMDTSAGAQWLYGNILYYKNNRWYTLRYDRSGSSALNPGLGYWVFSWQEGMTLDFVPPTRNEGPWVKTWGTEDFEYGSAVAVDSHGNIFSVGQGSNASYILKYDPSGTLLWEKGWGGNKFASAQAVTCDSQGNVYMGGDTNIGGSRLAAFLTKFSPNGDILWERTWRPTDDWARINGLTCDSQGNIVGCGYTNGWGEDVLVVKYDTGGNLLWAESWGDSGLMDYATAVRVDASDNIYLAGTTNSGELWWPEVLLMKLDTNGSLLNLKTWGVQDDCAYALALDGNQNIYLTGIQGSTSNTILLKYDDQFNLLFAKSWNNGGFSQGTGLEVDRRGNVFLGAENYSDSGGSMLILQYDTDGNLASQKSWHSDSVDETIRGMTIDQNGNLFLAGYVYASGHRWQPETGLSADIESQEDTVAEDPVPAAGNDNQIFGFGISVSGQETFAGGCDNVLVKYVPDYVEPNPRAQLTEISPDSGLPGSTVTINGSNLGDSGAITFAGAYAPVISWSDQQVICAVPAQAPLGVVEVQAACHSDFSNTLSFTILAPELVGINPASGIIGDTVTVSGSRFGATGSVTFAGNGAEIVSWSENQIVCLVPYLGGPGAQEVRVEVAGKTSEAGTFTLLYPQITDINPVSGRVGDTITISGSYFGSAMGTVTFEDFPSVCTAWSETRISCVVPYQTPSGVMVVRAVSASNCYSNSVNFTITAPVISGLSPTHGPIGTTVTVNGTGFGSSGTISIFEMPLTQLSWSETQIVCVVPLGAGTGPVAVNNQGKTSNVDQYFNIDQIPGGPQINDISPASGTPGTLITITGTNFGTDPGTLLFSGVEGPPVQEWIMTEVIVRTPTNFTGGGIIVTTPNGGYSNWTPFAHTVHTPCNLLCHFDGPEGSNSITDSSGFHSLVAHGNAHITNDWSKFGQSLYLPHVGDFVSAFPGDFAFSGDYTVDFWVLLDPAVGSGGDILTCGSDMAAPDTPPQWNKSWSITTVTGWSVYMFLHYFDYWYWPDPPPEDPAQNVPTFAHATEWASTSPDPLYVYYYGYPYHGYWLYWTHIAMMRHGTDTMAAFNGRIHHLVGSNYPGHSLFTAPGSWLDIGGEGNGGNSFSGGYIDELRIVNGKALWTSNFSVPDSPSGKYLVSRPNISGLYPTTALVGTPVTIYGSYFDDYQGDSKVLFNGNDAGNADSWSDNKIVVRVPAGTVSGQITLVINEQTNPNPRNFTVIYTTTPYTGGSNYYYRTWGGTGYETVKDQTLDAAGNVYQLGTTYDYGPDADQWSDILLLKYSSAGQLLWQKCWGGVGGDMEADAIAADKNGNVWVTGFVYASNGRKNFLLKFDSSGNLAWQEFYTAGDNENNTPIGLAVDNAGNGYLLSQYSGDVSWGNTATLLLKIAPDGSLIWQRSWFTDSVVSLALDPNRNALFMAGSSYNYDLSSYYQFLIKLSAYDGSPFWKKGWIAGSYYAHNLKKMKTDNQGNVYMISADSTPDWHTDIVTSKYDTNGNPCNGWPRAWNAWSALGAEPSINDLAFDANQNLYMTGLISSNGAPYYASNTLLLKYDRFGNLAYQKAWNKDHQAVYYNEGIALDISASGNLFLTSSIEDRSTANTAWVPGGFVNINGQSSPLSISSIPTTLYSFAMSGSVQDAGGTAMDVSGNTVFSSGTVSNYNPDVLLQRF